MYLGKPSKLFEKNHPDWLPTVSMGYDKKVGDVSRHQRVIKRNLEQLFTQKEDEAVATNIEEPKIISKPTTENLEDIDVDFTTVLQTHFTNTNSQTDITSNMLGLKEEEYIRTQFSTVHVAGRA